MQNKNTIWSDYIQSSEELYRSRSLRFRADNAAVWLPFLRMKDGAVILEKRRWKNIKNAHSKQY